MIARLALGTVQFGQPYGIANRSGQVCREETAAILDAAWHKGIDTLDTAIAYGESEKRLGEIGVSQWQIISKLPAIPKTCTDIADWVQEAVEGSLERLRVPRLRGLLLHRPLDLTGLEGDKLSRALDALKEQNLVEKIGVSIYSPDELDVLWPHSRPDLVQAPFNPIDRRLAASGWLARLHQSGVEVHIRSIFMQGLLLMERDARPAVFQHWQSLWNQWHCWLNEQSLNPLQACLGLAMSQPETSRVMIGVDSLRHLQEIFASIQSSAIMPPESLASDNPEIIDPRRWRRPA